MKFKMSLMVLCLLLVSISMAEALPLYTLTSDPSRIGTGGGGPFKVDPIGSGATFYTFCIETTEYINLGRTYYGSIESAAIYGGRYVDTWGGTPSSSSTSDPISLETKKLYDYALDNWATLNPEQLDAIQQAIWAFEAEVSYSALSALAQYYYGLPAMLTLDRNIMVLNLWTENAIGFSTKAQSMLIAVPEPGILILLGIALSAVGLASRRYKF